MFDITQLFSSTAAAQTPGATDAPGGAPGSILMSFAPLLAIFAVFYVLLIRPQQKKLAEQEKQIKALQKGDRIITGGGVYGKIVKLDGEDSLIVEIADGIQIKVVRSTVSPVPVAPAAPPKAIEPTT
jgi:preprotein translocase subunit YajC